MPASMYDVSGRAVPFGRELGKGGEGYVREVAGYPETVAKIYHATALPPGKIEKLRLLPSFATADLLSVSAWPTGTLSDTPGGAVRGILLPRVSGREIHFVYSPGQRRQHFPKSDWSLLVHIAMNAAAAVQTIHDTGTIIGDLNQGGFFVSDDGKVRLIDCDSFQIRHNGKTYRCVVRVPHFTPPELQAADLSAVDATVNHDSFGLGILVFHLLFMGRHPFAGRYLGTGDMPIEKAIAERRFAFGPARLSYQMDVPPNAPSLRLVPPRLAELFERAFRGDPQRRPLAADWYGELRALRAALRKCQTEPSHVFSSHLTSCPWCELEHGGGPTFFSFAIASFDFDPGFDIEALWKEIENLKTVPDGILNGIYPRGVRPRELCKEAEYRALGPQEAIPSMPVLHLVPIPELPQFRPGLNPGDEGSGYIPEEEPTLPAFTPSFLPVERHLEFFPVPNPPQIKRIDHFAKPKLRSKQVRCRIEYRLAKWASITGIICSVFLEFKGLHLLAAAVGLLVGAGFGFAWWTLWMRMRREFKYGIRAAKKAYEKDEERIRVFMQEFDEQRVNIEQANHQRQIDFEKWKANFEQLRTDLPHINAREHMLWEEKCMEIKRQQQAVRERNGQRLNEWYQRMREEEAQARQRWETSVAHVLKQREAVELENRQRRNDWEKLLPRYNESVRAIIELNDRRAKARERYEMELKQREQAALKAERDFQEIQHRWNLETSRHKHELEKVMLELATIRRKYLTLKASFERERDQLMSGARQAQLDDFLTQQLLANATISGIGQKRKDTLLGFGIESAYHISDVGLSLVYGQGFGNKLINALYSWRHECERRFVFNSQKQVVSPALTKLHAKYQSERNASKNSYLVGMERVKEKISYQSRAGQQALAEGTKAMGVLAQATADLQHTRRY